MKKRFTFILGALLLIGLAAGACLGGGILVLNIAGRPVHPPQLRLEGVRRLNPDAGAYHDPAWSPDGRYLAYTRADVLAGREQTPKIYVMDLETGQHRQLTQNVGRVRSPSWSPDGTRIAFDSMKNSFLQPSQIWVMNADGTGARQLTRCPQSCYGPAWKPDGQKLLIKRIPAKGEPGELYVLNPASGELEWLMDPRYNVLDAAWSPDGMHIAFTETDLSYPSSGYWGHIVIVNSDGGHSRELPSVGVYDSDPTWSPNGRYLAFVSEHLIQGQSLDNGKIFIMDLETEEVYPLLEGDFELGFAEPAWSPDGRYIAFVYGWPSSTTDLYVAEVPEIFR